MGVYLTFADAERLVRERVFAARRRFPAGRIHAALADAERTLCGITLEHLSRFGRSRHPFERFPSDRRCEACDRAAGRPAP